MCQPLFFSSLSAVSDPDGLALIEYLLSLSLCGDGPIPRLRPRPPCVNPDQPEHNLIIQTTYRGRFALYIFKLQAYSTSRLSTFLQRQRPTRCLFFLESVEQDMF